ncbi:thioredoxin-like [Mizuhopecten yessoensis]|uniref:Thioredoxin n=1 Tax=Mizuhopecten yessoensis TaxID=6573 RepID=A0A210R5I7_MIZYE|nr:thioredoxin-like [Mizuhopecten yessoensis]OWF56299.1 Thioredoxin [Mizuhopecten yessoensis]
MKDVYNMEQFETILREAGNKLVVVDFKATWCGPCKAIGPVYKNMAENEEYKNVVFCTVDVDEAPEVAEEYEVEMMPAFMFFKNGKKIKEILGANKDKIKSFIEETM